MFVNVGRFHFRPMNSDEQQDLLRRMEADIPPLARESPGFRGVYCARPGPDEVLMV